MHWYHSQVGYVQQDPYGALAPFMTVQRILEEPLIIGGIKDKEERSRRIRKAMEEVKLTPVEDFLANFRTCSAADSNSVWSLPGP